LKYDNSITLNNDDNKSISMEDIGPKKLRKNAQYRAWVESILTEASGYEIHYSEHTGKYIKTTPVKESRQYDFSITVEFNHRQSDANVIKYISQLLRRINRYCSRWNYEDSGRVIQGYAFLETHYKSFKLEGCNHSHIMCYFPDTFHTKPTFDKLEKIAAKASDKLNAIAKRDKIHVVDKAQLALDKANKLNDAGINLTATERRLLKKAVDQAESNLKKAERQVENLIFSDSGVHVDEIYDPDKLLDYVSKQLNKDNLDQRIMVLGPNGLDGNIPTPVRFNQSTRGFWTNSEAKKWNYVGTFTNPDYC